MSENERDGIGSFAALMNEVDSNVIGVVAEVMEPGEALDLRFPVEVVFPIGADILQKAEIETVAPARARYFVRPAGAREAVSKIVECGL